MLHPGHSPFRLAGWRFVLVLHVRHLCVRRSSYVLAGRLLLMLRVSGWPRLVRRCYRGRETQSEDQKQTGEVGHRSAFHILPMAGTSGKIEFGEWNIPNDQTDALR